MKNKTEKDGKRFLLWLIVLTIIALASCTKNIPLKETIYRNSYYSITIDWYSEGDTDFIKRTYGWHDSVSAQFQIYMHTMDTLSDQWNLMCLPYRHIEHLYYLRNGIKIQKSNYPK